jgi:REP element-mobilizing transposase RayT
MARYSRRLPHWDITGEPVFVTFRLHGSLPASRIFPPDNVTPGQAFAALDKLLDRARTGPIYLARPEIADLVVQAMMDGQERFQRYKLHAYVAMPNHVHMLATPLVPFATWLKSLKGYTGFEAIRLLGISPPFWQDESYDHLVRDAREFERLRGYIENNPVRAGLCAAPEDYPWSSAARPVPQAAPSGSSVAGPATDKLQTRPTSV